MIGFLFLILKGKYRIWFLEHFWKYYFNLKNSKNGTSSLYIHLSVIWHSFGALFCETPVQLYSLSNIFSSHSNCTCLIYLFMVFILKIWILPKILEMIVFRDFWGSVCTIDFQVAIPRFELVNNKKSFLMSECRWCDESGTHSHCPAGFAVAVYCLYWLEELEIPQVCL